MTFAGEPAATAHFDVSYGRRKPYVRCKSPEDANLVRVDREYDCWDTARSPRQQPNRAAAAAAAA
ncbi:hypothetical protein [Nocardia sp. NPDC052566]|uniref:hypothetical protein n=1 Tax=Nocardia sp. NPDC052566 TaxID=3364330 RepID=UPI0037C7F068